MSRSTWMTILVCTLGYFVDIYDLVLFSVVRVPSLKSLGYEGADLLNVGVTLLNSQMIGMLIGGVLWGMLGDKKGRVSTLFGSILLYSVANIANAFVQNAEQYAVLRFLAGIGLAGELGAALTLVSEIMPKETRGYGATIVAGVGLSGAIAAGISGQQLDWKTAYIVGGVLGLILLVLRVSTAESTMFSSLKNKSVSRGNFLKLFYPRKRFLKYLACIAIGLPVWCVVGILVTFSPEICPLLGITEPISVGKAIMNTYIGVTVGDIIAGLLSQLLRNRRKVVFGYLCLILLSVFATLGFQYKTADAFYNFCILLGFATGYWAVFTAVAAEQFGTNLRASAAVSIPNIVRAGVVPLTFAFRSISPTLSPVLTVAVLSTACVAIAMIALWSLQETFGKDLDYLEE